MQIRAGFRIREYEIMDRLGRGGMGAVYKARHIYLNKIRAIKLIHTAFAGEQEYSDRFIQEAKILSELNHPNLVRLFEFGTLEDTTFFMVLEFVQGESLLHRIRRKGRMSLQAAIHIARQAAMGLHSAHQLGIIHRDISPDNILLVKDASGTEIAKVIDFGVAKAVLESQRLTATNVFLGKPEYCSPEQTGFLGEPNVDQRSDIYSLGVTFYQMLAGKLPFYATTPQGYLVKHANESAQSILSHFSSGEVPKELDLVFKKALAKRQQDRYATMQEFAEELDRVEFLAGNLYRTMAVEDPQNSFRDFFDKGKQCFDNLEWDEAIRWWNQANDIYSDEAVHQWIAAAREKQKVEKEVRTAIFKELESCEQLVYGGNLQKAEQVLSRVEKSLLPEYDLGDLHIQVATLREKLTASDPISQRAAAAASQVRIVLWIFLSVLFLILVTVVSAFFIPRILENRKKAGQTALIKEIQTLTDQGRYREARKRLFLLEEEGMDSQDFRYKDLETQLKTKEQSKATALLFEAESALNLGNVQVAENKIKELESARIDGYETQIANLKERIRQFSEYNTIAEKTRTPLMWAIFRGNREEAGQLLHQGASVNAADGNGYTVLMYAIWKTPDLVTAILQRGADVNAKDNRSVTALHVATDLGQLESVTMLLVYRANVNVQNVLGATPLIVAATRGQTDIARLLINSGADLTIKTPNGYDALKTAEYYNYHEIANLIRQKLGGN